VNQTRTTNPVATHSGPSGRDDANTTPAKANAIHAVRHVPRAREMAMAVKAAAPTTSGPLVEADAPSTSALGDTAAARPTSTTGDPPTSTQAAMPNSPRHSTAVTALSIMRAARAVWTGRMATPFST